MMMVSKNYEIKEESKKGVKKERKKERKRERKERKIKIFFYFLPCFSNRLSMPPELMKVFGILTKSNRKTKRQVCIGISTFNYIYHDSNIV